MAVRLARDLSALIYGTKVMRGGYEEAGWVPSLCPMQGRSEKISEDGAVFCCLLMLLDGMTRFGCVLLQKMV